MKTDLRSLWVLMSLICFQVSAGDTISDLVSPPVQRIEFQFLADRYLAITARLEIGQSISVDSVVVFGNKQYAKTDSINVYLSTRFDCENQAHGTTMERTIIDILRGASALFYDSYNSLGSISVYYQGMKYPVIYQLPFSYRDCIGIECPQVVLSYPRAVDSIDYDTLQCLLKKNYQAGNYVFTAKILSIGMIRRISAFFAAM